MAVGIKVSNLTQQDVIDGDVNIHIVKDVDGTPTSFKTNVDNFIYNNSITTAKIADSNVTTAKIADANVTTAKIADSNVTTAKIADSNVTFAKLADVIDDGTMATATDTTLATSESIKAYVDASSIKIASYESASGNTSSNIALPVTEVSDPSNIGSVSSGTVTLAAGTYLVAFNGEFAEDNNDNTDFFTVQLRHNGAAKTSDKINETGSASTYIFISHTILVSGDSSQTVDIRLTETGTTALNYRNVSLNFIKIA